MVGFAIARLVGGADAVAALMQEGPLSLLPQTMLSAAVVWCGIAIAALWLLLTRADGRHALEVAGCLLLVVLHVNILRERTRYGDVSDYVRAAFDLAAGQPLWERYLYPPFLATSLQPLLPLGNAGVQAALWLANIVALAIFYWLTAAVLRRYGFARGSAFAITFLALVVNVPLLRTLAYVQVNLHLANAVMAALLLAPRYPLFSGFMLSFAVHLKAAPAMLVLAFIHPFRSAWWVGFTGGIVLLATLTIIPFGVQPFADFAANAARIHDANPISFRDSSVDSIIRSTAHLYGGEVPLLLIAIPKAFLILFAGWVAFQCVRRHAFVSPKQDAALCLNALPALLLIMLLASPILWEHHPIFVLVPYLLLIPRLSSPGEWAVYTAAWAIQFLLPTFDLYPWSFGRLVSALAILALMARLQEPIQTAGFSVFALRLEELLRPLERIR